jgi:phenylpropionate dioxygenase-like ring-hydroxylating dioxygenase large terminal subunit
LLSPHERSKPLAASIDQSLWKNYWHLLCHRSEVENPRDFLKFDVAGEEVVVFNDGKDVIAFDNRCPHRGARIFDGAAGNARFICQYHGWSYSKGTVFIADKAQFSHCDLSGVRLSGLQTAWVGDFLFVSAAPLTDVEAQLGGAVSVVRAISTSIGKRWDLNSYDYDCIWPIAVENALEPYHVSSVHPKSLNLLGLTEGRNEYHGQNSIWFSEVSHEQTAKRLAKLGRLFSLDYQHLGYVNIYLFPFSMISSTFGLSYSVQNFFPSSATDKSHFTSRLYQSTLRAGTNPAITEGFLDSTAALNRQVFEEDMKICARIPSRSWSPEPLTVFARDEDRLMHFRTQYRKAAGDAA